MKIPGKQQRRGPGFRLFSSRRKCEFFLEEDMLRRLQDHADKRKVPVAAVVREAVAVYLATTDQARPIAP